MFDFLAHNFQNNINSAFMAKLHRNVPVPRSVAPMGNVTKYLQKLRMGVYDNENQPGILRKITRIWGNHVLANTDWK